MQQPASHILTKGLVLKVTSVNWKHMTELVLLQVCVVWDWSPLNVKHGTFQWDVRRYQLFREGGKHKSGTGASVSNFIKVITVQKHAYWRLQIYSIRAITPNKHEGGCWMKASPSWTEGEAFNSVYSSCAQEILRDSDVIHGTLLSRELNTLILCWINWTFTARLIQLVDLVPFSIAILLLWRIWSSSHQQDYETWVLSFSLL